MTRRTGRWAIVSVVLAAGCTSSSPAPSTTPTAASVGTRWWSNGAAAIGSTIDPAHPVSGRLRSSRTSYCAMLRQTVAAGRSVLSGTTTGGAAATTAFLDEVTAVAPTALVASWRVLDRALVALLAAGGNAAAIKGVDTVAVQRAVATISADSRSACGVSLSR